MKKTRNSNIESIRLLAMLFITMHHFALWGVMSAMHVPTASINTFFAQIFEMFGKVGVFIFIIITGYYSKPGKLSFRKVFALSNTVRLFTIGALLVVGIFGIERWDWTLVVRSVFPIVGQMYWFITAYAILTLASGYIVAFVNTLDRNRFQEIILLSVVLFSVIPTFFFGWKSTVSDLIPGFLIGIYLKNRNGNNPKTSYLKVTLYVGILIMIVLLGIIDYLGMHFNSLPIIKAANYFMISSGSPFALLFASLIFMLTNNRDDSNNKVINKLASASLSVYLIQEFPPLRHFIWFDLFRVSRNAMLDSPVYFILYSIATVLLVFTGALLFGLGLNSAASRPMNFLLNVEMKIFEWVRLKIKILIKKINSLYH